MVPKVSVLTTVYNCEKYIEGSVNSILNQTFPDYEYVIIEDGSTDMTGKVLKELSKKDKRIFLHENGKNLGRVTSLNKALEMCRGKYIAIQDADDISLPGRLEKLLSFLEDNSNYVLVGSNIIIVDENENFISSPIRPSNDFDVKFNLLFRCTFANPTIMFRKKIVDENNLRYDKNFGHSEDFRFISLLSRFGKVYIFEDALVKYRKHFSNNSMIHFDTLNSQSSSIARNNLESIGVNVSDVQVGRIRSLLASRGIETKFLYEDIELIMEAIKAFRERNDEYYSPEIALILKRMSNWIGKKNIIFKPKFSILYLKIILQRIRQLSKG